MAAKRKTVFVSYAHKDRKWVDELITFLAPWIRDGRVRFWDDSKILAGARWEAEIATALSEATVAVLLVTKHFLASKFITERELPLLVERAHKGEVRLNWIAVEHSGVEATELVEFQATNDPARPLDTLSKPQRNKVMVQIAKNIADALTMGTLAGGFQIIDETTEQFEAAAERRPPRPQRPYHVQANYEPRKERIAFSNTTTAITAADFERLPEEDREFIADLEDSLKANYARWKTLHKELGNAAGALDGEVEGQITRVAKLICRDLNSILEFLRKMHKYELEDHYGRYRFICQKLGSA